MLLGDEFGYKGYSYLLVLDGYACMCTVLFDNFNLVKDCLRKTKELFLDKYKLKIKNPKNVGGIGHYDVKGNFVKGNRLYVGESAGIQDMLFGFGIRSSLYSGYLAAESIINYRDYVENYEKIANLEFSKRLKAGLVNRFFWTKMGKDYSLVIRMLKKSKDPMKLLDKVYNYGIMHKISFPFVYWFNK